MVYIIWKSLFIFILDGKGNNCELWWRDVCTCIPDCHRKLKTLPTLLLSQAGETEARTGPRLQRPHAEALMFLLLELFYFYHPEAPLHLKWAEIPLHLKKWWPPLPPSDADLGRGHPSLNWETAQNSGGSGNVLHGEHARQCKESSQRWISKNSRGSFPEIPLQTLCFLQKQTGCWATASHVG